MVVSGLESTVVGSCVSVDSKGVRMHKNCAFFTRFWLLLMPQNLTLGEGFASQKRKSGRLTAAVQNRNNSW